jgi:cyclopropane fatty-acyl-phospholipid synthase-like methyltransferase
MLPLLYTSFLVLCLANVIYTLYRKKKGSLITFQGLYGINRNHLCGITNEEIHHGDYAPFDHMLHLIIYYLDVDDSTRVLDLYSGMGYLDLYLSKYTNAAVTSYCWSDDEYNHCRHIPCNYRKGRFNYNEKYDRIIAICDSKDINVGRLYDSLNPEGILFVQTFLYGTNEFYEYLTLYFDVLCIDHSADYMHTIHLWQRNLKANKYWIEQTHGSVTWNEINDHWESRYDSLSMKDGSYWTFICTRNEE